MLDLYVAIISKIEKISKTNNQVLIIGYERKSENKFVAGETHENLLKRLSEISENVVDLTLTRNTEDFDTRYQIHEQDDHPSAFANKEKAIILKNFIDDLVNSN